jgi:translation initiation factor 2 subunit 3
MNIQPIYNIGTLGSVSDGKSTLVEKLTGIKTQRHSYEQTRNITIKSGYANLKIWINKNNKYTTIENSDNIKLVNHISIPDLAGHSAYITSMLSSLSLMDGAIIVIAVDQVLSNKPQLIQHLAAAKISKIKKIIICMNKIDLVSKNILMERKKELDILLDKYEIKPYIIIPTCFNKNIGIEYVINAIMNLFNPNEYIEKTLDKPIFIINRTFDINKPGTNWDNINGGVLGGTLLSGKLKKGDEIEIRPGINEPFFTKIISIKTGDVELDEVLPGGLIGIKTDIDPFYCKNDKLIGNIAGLVGYLPNIYDEINVKITIINIFDFKWIPAINDIITLKIGTRVCDATLIDIKENNFKIKLKKLTCIKNNEHIIICKMFNNALKIIGECFFYENI